MHDDLAPRSSITRRTLLQGTGSIAAGSMLGGLQAFGQEAYPTRPVRIIVGFGAGGLADITMRILAEKLSERLGQRFFVENRPGAGGIVAAQAAASAAPDGYTLLVLSIGTTMSVSLLKAMPFNLIKDFVPISSVAFFDLILMVNADSPMKTLGDFLGDARKRGNAINIGTIASGSVQNLSAELFKSAAGIDATIVTHRTTPEVQVALTRGDVSLAFESYAAQKGPVDAGQFRVLATTGKSRSLPNVPTVQESGLPTYEVEGWNSLFAPANTPPAIVNLLNRHIVESLALPDVRNRIIELGTEPRSSTPDELGVFLRNEIKKWGEVIEHAKIEKR